jgi:hypothetical protein
MHGTGAANACREPGNTEAREGPQQEPRSRREAAEGSEMQRGRQIKKLKLIHMGISSIMALAKWICKIII